MQGIIKQRAKERKLEFEKAEQAKRMAEALVSEESGRAMHSPLHAPRASNSPSRSSSPTLERLRTALGGNLATDGDESQRANLTILNICQKLLNVANVLAILPIFLFFYKLKVNLLRF